MSDPLISVIVPIYNTQKYLRKCFNSIAKQTYNNLEIILINDGSTDGSDILCDEFRKQDSRVKIITQKNKGLSSARNSGLNVCHGEFVTFIDSDDYVEKDYIEYLFNLSKKNQSEIAICAHQEIENERIRCNFGQRFSEKHYTSKECLKAMLNEEGFMVSAWGKLYKKNLFDDVRFPTGKLHEDLGTTYKLIMISKSITYGPEPKYCYVQHINSIVNSGFNEQKLDIITQTDEMAKIILQKYPDLEDVVIARRIHARFSVLKLMLKEKKLSPKMQTKKKEIKAFIVEYKNQVLASKNAPKRTKIAIKTLVLGEPIFILSWKVYSKLFK